VFGHKGHFHAKENRYGLFELGSRNKEAIKKVASMLRRYFGVKWTASIYDNQGRSWVRVIRRSEIQKLLSSGLFNKAPQKEANVKTLIRSAVRFPAKS